MLTDSLSHVTAAYELTLAEGNRLEKRLFHATFATVSRRTHLRASEWRFDPVQSNQRR